MTLPYFLQHSINSQGELYTTLCDTPPFCPICQVDALTRRIMPDLCIGERYWHCLSCHTEWEVEDLIRILEEEVL